jgi:membrane associated rhomboid family serine protease
MIFIPFFGKIDWSNPPLVTFILIITNCLIFFTFQANDNARAVQAFEYYLDSELPAIEMPLYVKYLDERNEWEQADRYRDFIEQKEYTEKYQSFDAQSEIPDDGERPLASTGDEMAQTQRALLVVTMKSDSGFQQQLRNGNLFENNKTYQRWQSLNNQFESRMNKITTYQYGLKPNNPTLLTLFSNMFLHGGFGHLLGNMIFLFIIGFVVETALGKAAYSIGYLLTGLAGGALYIAFNSSSHIPTIGASGAIAGLMGMYTVLFGVRKINFFYFVFVYFDYIKAPAIVLLPIWLGHEIFQLLMSSNDGVNYFAHIGGIVSGAAFAALMKHGLGKVNIDYLDREEKQEQKTDQYETAMEHLAKMQVDKALALLRPLVSEHPDNRDYLLQWYKAAKLQPASDDFHEAAKCIMMLRDKNTKTYQLVYNTYQEYMKLAQPKAKLSAKLCLHLVLTFALGKYFNDAERLIVLVKNHKMKEPVAEAILALANAFQKADDAEKSRTYLELLRKNFAETAAASEADRRLNVLQEKAG